MLSTLREFTKNYRDNEDKIIMKCFRIKKTKSHAVYKSKSKLVAGQFLSKKSSNLDMRFFEKRIFHNRMQRLACSQRFLTQLSNVQHSVHQSANFQKTQIMLLTGPRM